MSKLTTITVAIPSFSRPFELNELLESISRSTRLPDEILVCEDCSPKQSEISLVAKKWERYFSDKDIRFVYVENNENCGYDKNLRNLFEFSTSEYVFILGDDDMVSIDGFRLTYQYLEKNSEMNFVSRSFTRFDSMTGEIINTTWLSKVDFVYRNNEQNASEVFRLCGFVGGLVINRIWAVNLATNKYDGGLYYQFYLACNAYNGSGIGYISYPIVMARAGNPPLFGSSSNESSIHVPGSYQPRGRISMWKSLISIAEDMYPTGPFKKNLKRELANRQSIHVFEMMPAQGRAATFELYLGYTRIGLGLNFTPILLTFVILIFGQQTSFLFRTFRKIQLLIEHNLKIKL